MFHVTSSENVQSILDNGLVGIADSFGRRKQDSRFDGLLIFLIATNEEKVLKQVASKILWPYEDFSEFAVIHVEENGFSQEHLHEDSFDNLDGHLFFVKQEVIEPYFLSLYKTIKWKWNGAERAQLNSQLHSALKEGNTAEMRELFQKLEISY